MLIFNDQLRVPKSQDLNNSHSGRNFEKTVEFSGHTWGVWKTEFPNLRHYVSLWNNRIKMSMYTTEDPIMFEKVIDVTWLNQMK